MKLRVHIHDQLESELCLVGAADAASLAAAIDRLLAFLARAPETPLKDLALTTSLEARGAVMMLAIVALSPDDLGAKLTQALARLRGQGGRLSSRKGLYFSESPLLPAGKLAFLFPGEGSQYPDMLREICLHLPACRSAFDDADTACAQRQAALLPSRWIFPMNDAAGAPRADSDPLGLAGAVQAALAADTALLRLFTTLGIAPHAVTGSGVGEIVALECAGVFNFDRRASRIQALAEGYALMTALTARKQLDEARVLTVGGLARQAIDAALARHAGKLLLARADSPEHFALCARPVAVDTVVQELTEQGGVVRVLPANRPYHTAWFEHGLPALRHFFDTWIQRTPRLPIYSCLTAAPLPAARAEMVAACTAQWAQPVQFARTIERLYDDGCRIFVELGARSTLTTAVEATLRHRGHFLAVATNRAHREGMLQLHHALAALAAQGVRFDVTPLHARRGSRPLDLARPRAARRGHAERAEPLAAELPSFRSALVPPELIAPSAAPPVGRAAARTPGLAAETPRAEQPDFPLLTNATVSSEDPGETITLLQTVSVFDQPFLADSSLGTNQVSVVERTLRGMPMMPLMMAAEFMAEAARRLRPDKVVIAIEGLRFAQWFTLEERLRRVSIEARCLPGGAPTEQRVAACLRDAEGAAAGGGGALLASATLLLAERYPAPSNLPRPPPLHAPLTLDWRTADIYPGRLYHGPRFQSILGITQWGENGLSGDVQVLPRGELLRQHAAPRFALDPVLTGSIGAALALWHGREPFSGRVQLPLAVRELRFFAPPPPEGARVTLTLRTLRNSGESVLADAQLLDAEGQPLLSVSAWENHVFAIPAALHRLLHLPAESFLTRPLESDDLPGLPPHLFCSVADRPSDGLFERHQTLWLQATANLTLSPTERVTWREMGGGLARRTEWLLGRVAAKDAIRRCLAARYGRRWAAADIRIETDEAGKPRPQGEWRRHCGAMMDISIAHTQSRVVAAVAPNGCVGIDVERRDRAISDDFAAAAFCPTEQELAAESGEGATALLRFWCAKEALAKALGTGLRYGANDLVVQDYDRASGRVTMRLTRLWTQVFPHLRQSGVTVHTGCFENLILAVCALDPELARPAAAVSPGPAVTGDR